MRENNMKKKLFISVVLFLLILFTSYICFRMTFYSKNKPNKDPNAIDIPDEIKNLKVEDLSNAPTYYFITLDNNRETQRHSTPQMSMSGYLFNDKLWECKRVSDSVTNEGDCYSLIRNDKSFNPIFLFITFFNCIT